MANKYTYVLMLFLGLMSCQSDQPIGNEILFADVIGNYEGECANYISSTSELMNREEATLSVFAANTDAAGITTSCDRIMEQNIPVSSASAAEVVFESRMGNTTVTMTYIAQQDSIVIIKSVDGEAEDLIFTGIRN